MINSYNPDVLNTLANLSSDEVFSSPELVNRMLDLLPKSIWSDKKIKFLDPFSKSGVFLREITKRLLKGLEKEIPILQDRIDYILKNQVYGIAITELTASISRRTLYCSKIANSKYSISNVFENQSGNILYERIEHKWSNGRCVYCFANEIEYSRDNKKENYAYKLIHTNKPEEIFNMKFDVIVGNPPYQLSDGGAQSSAIPIYNKFVLQSIKLNPKYITMIIPSRWFSGGKGLDDFRGTILRDKSLVKLFDFPNSSDCFPGVQIEGGVCYFLWDRDNQNELCEINTLIDNKIVSSSKRRLLEKDNDILLRYNESVSIYNKVKNKTKKTYESIVSSRKPFGLPTFFEGNKDYKKGMIKVYGNKKVSYVKEQEIETNKNWIWKHKVLISKAYGMGSSSIKQVLNKPFISEPGSVCTETYLTIGPFQNIKQAQEHIDYIKTKFFRFLVLLRKSTQDGTKNVYKYVPLFEDKILNNDKELYNYFNLDKMEIDYIESTIKDYTKDTNEEDVND
jgi:site-specific DNA-methyltransferase (adenine-specific)